MKKILLFVMLILAIFMVGCDRKSETMMNTKSIEPVKEGTRSFSENVGGKVFHYGMTNKRELIDWLNSKQSMEINNGAFSTIVDLYVNQSKYILVPNMGQNEIKNIFIDSNNNFINYIFVEPSMRICIEPINTKENKNINTTDIKKYTEQKYDVILNEEESIPMEEQVNSMGVKTGYEYDSYIYTTKTVEFKYGTKKCVLKKKDSEKSDTEYMLSFIEDEMLVKIFYYDSEDDTMSLKKLRELSFEKEILKK